MLVDVASREFNFGFAPARKGKFCLEDLYICDDSYLQHLYICDDSYLQHLYICDDSYLQHLYICNDSYLQHLYICDDSYLQHLQEEVSGSTLNSTAELSDVKLESSKRALDEASTLQIPDFKREFVLVTDASDLAVSAVLHQRSDGELVSISCHSRLLAEPERKRSTYN
jgi:hypothetical protein